MTPEEKQYLLRIARESIAEGLGEPMEEGPSLETEMLREKRGAFVTLTKGGRLRGCIGYIRPVKPLSTAIREMAQAAAFDDPRFPPLTAKEFRGLNIEISVLTPLREVRSFDEIDVGRHGLFLVQGHCSGLLLPQVAVEYGWDRDTFLAQTCRKAGLPESAWRDPETRVYIFSAEIF